MWRPTQPQLPPLHLPLHQLPLPRHVRTPTLTRSSSSTWDILSLMSTQHLHDCEDIVCPMASVAVHEARLLCDHNQGFSLSNLSFLLLTGGASVAVSASVSVSSTGQVCGCPVTFLLLPPGLLIFQSILKNFFARHPANCDAHETEPGNLGSTSTERLLPISRECHGCRSRLRRPLLPAPPGLQALQQQPLQPAMAPLQLPQ